MAYDITGKVVLITGAARGIGEDEEIFMAEEAVPSGAAGGAPQRHDGQLGEVRFPAAAPRS